KASQVYDGIIVDGSDKISIPDVMYPRNVLVTDAFDTVSAKPVFKEGGALLSFTGDNFSVREDLFKVIACRKRTSRTSSGNIASQAIFGTQNFVSRQFKSIAGENVMP